ncbi:MAG TPA: FAD-dependent oxidoreductase [Flavitalea sp.]|nr:FAD-dependent oxidoreductase [Flavitalea sp.]
MKQDIVIVGGGVIGLCCAYYLQKRGFSITVIDRGNITSGTSFGNAGYVSPSHFMPLASPGIVAKGLRWMLSADSPFYIKPRFDWDLIRWGLNFYRKANASTVKVNAIHLNNILQLSRELTSEMKQEMGNHFRMEEKGCLMLYKSALTEKHELELAEEARKFHIDTIPMSAQQVQSLEPEVQVNVRGGVLYPIDCHLHPGDFMSTLRRHLEKLGVSFLLGAEVRAFEVNDHTVRSIITDKGKIESDEFILAGGSWLPAIASLLKIHILIQAGKGYSITYPDIKRNLHYPAILVDDRVAMTPMGKDLRMGGTMEIAGINNQVLIRRVQAIFNAARNYYPDLPVEFPVSERIWQGLRPLTPDGLPYIGRNSKLKNVVIAGGHAMLGLSLAAATGKLVEEIITNSKTSIDISAFDVERYN